MWITYTQGLLSQVNVRDLDQLAAENRNRAMVHDSVRDTGKGFHEVGKTPAGKNLRLQILVALISTPPCAHSEGRGKCRILVLLCYFLIISLVLVIPCPAKDPD